MTKTKELEFTLEKTSRDLIDPSRLVWMAEVTTSVLHDVGIVVNSLGVSARVIRDGVRQLEIERVGRISVLLLQQDTGESKEPQIAEHLRLLSSHLLCERSRLLEEVDRVLKHVEHVMAMIAMQQSYAKMVGIVEPTADDALMEDAVRMNSSAIARHDVHVEREYQRVPRVLVERGKVLQILVNLIRNAEYACDERGGGDSRITLRIEAGSEGRVRLIVSDNGIGIPAENLSRIFSHGFTTRDGGHGFGLHSSALAAKELNGLLSVASDGPNRGATFVLELPAAEPGERRIQ